MEVVREGGRRNVEVALHQEHAAIEGAISELLAEETGFKTMIGISESRKKIVLAQVFVASNNKGRNSFTEKSKFHISIDECSYCHSKGHRKKDCPYLPHKAQDFNERQSQRGHSQSGQSPYPNRFSHSQPRVPRPPTANTSSESRHAAKSSALSGNDNSSNLSSLFAAEVSSLGISSTPSVLFVSSTSLSLITSSDSLTKWILDSGVSHHMTPHISLLHNTFPPLSPH
ncbi:hypothetical protein QYF36_017521 [Acer negundo]|nr:hypothetical protein QYF36_017521 [Acer negundo]